MMKSLPSIEERIWAVLSHFSAVTFGIGIFLPVIGWSDQRRKSNYASFQCLQALGYQSLGYTIWILFALVIVIAQSLNTFSELLTAAESGADFDMLVSLAMGGHFVVMMGLIGLYVLLPVSAAIACALGKDFHYPILGNRLARYVGYDISSSEDWLIEDHEDRFIAAMGHFGVIIILWGMLAPLTAWIVQGKRSFFLKFQSMQTLVYQACVTFLFLGAGFVFVFGFLAFLGTVGLSEGDALDETAMIGIALFGLSMLVVVGMILIVPLLHILGQWAGYRVLKGDDYRYPLVGRLIEKRLANQTSLSAASSPPRTAV